MMTYKSNLISRSAYEHQDLLTVLPLQFLECTTKMSISERAARLQKQARYLWQFG